MSGRERQEFNSLEDQLAAALKPVPPKQDFVRTVRQRMTLAAPVVAIRPAPDLSGWLLTLTEVISVCVVVAVVARVLYLFFDRQR
jgi:hypothetical protein